MSGAVGTLAVALVLVEPLQQMDAHEPGGGDLLHGLGDGLAGGVFGADLHL